MPVILYTVGMYPLVRMINVCIGRVRECCDCEMCVSVNRPLRLGYLYEISWRELQCLQKLLSYPAERAHDGAEGSLKRLWYFNALSTKGYLSLSPTRCFALPFLLYLEYVTFWYDRSRTSFTIIRTIPWFINSGRKLA